MLGAQIERSSGCQRRRRAIVSDIKAGRMLTARLAQPTLPIDRVPVRLARRPLNQGQRSVTSGTLRADTGKLRLLHRVTLSRP